MYTNILDAVRALVGDWSDDINEEVIYYAICAALARYSLVCERVVYDTVELSSTGFFSHPMTTKETDDPVCDIVYVHWPASSSVGDTVNDNQVLDWWYCFNEDGYLHIDMQVSGSTVPTSGDYVLIGFSMHHRIDGMDFDSFGGSDTSEVSTLPKSHEYILALGAAAYVLRAREAGPQMLISPGEGQFISAYHPGVMAEMSDRFMRDFEQELYKLSLLRLHRPPWGHTERDRLGRVLE